MLVENRCKQVVITTRVKKSWIGGQTPLTSGHTWESSDHSLWQKSLVFFGQASMLKDKFSTIFVGQFKTIFGPLPFYLDHFPSNRQPI